jgi:GNAT superfamily N-acetyltransferase
MNLLENINRIKQILNLIGEEISSETLDVLEIEEGSGDFKFMVNSEVSGMMKGTRDGDTLWIDRIVVYPKWRDKGMGERFIIHYLTKFGGSIGSKSQLRNRSATKMWERIIKRNDIDSEVGELYSEYQNGVIPTFRVWEK